VVVVVLPVPGEAPPCPARHVRLEVVEADQPVLVRIEERDLRRGELRALVDDEEPEAYLDHRVDQERGRDAVEPSTLRSLPGALVVDRQEEVPPVTLRALAVGRLERPREAKRRASEQVRDVPAR
jgi:hypothetical protein